MGQKVPDLLARFFVEIFQKVGFTCLPCLKLLEIGVCVHVSATVREESRDVLLDLGVGQRDITGGMQMLATVRHDQEFNVGEPGMRLQ